LSGSETHRCRWTRRWVSLPLNLSYGLRRDVEAAGDDRVGVNAAIIGRDIPEPLRPKEPFE